MEATISHEDVPYRNHLSRTEIHKLHPRSQYEKHDISYNPKEYTPEGEFIGDTTGDIEVSVQLRSKPKGLWYSLGDGWLNFDNYEQTDKCEYKGYLYTVEIDEDVFINISQVSNKNKILRLNSMNDRKIFYQKYKRINISLRTDGVLGPDLGLIFQLINWVQVSNDYAGLEIPDINRSNQLDSRWCYGWDVPSGCIWNTNIINYFKIT